MRPPGRLVVCPTPIGNLEDITLRTLAALRDADVVACEDTRRTRVLLDRYAVRVPTISYHEHNERRRAGELAARMRAGETVALVSDAGMPLLSDPGLELVRASVAAGLAVEVLPGPSAVPVALAASGIAAERWTFVGFLPRREGALREALSRPEALVAFEAPGRVGASLRVLAELEPERDVAVCRELTKLHEEVVRGTAADLAARYAEQRVRGEVVLVVGPGHGAAADEGAAVEAVQALVAAGARARPAARVVSSLTGVPANALYRATASSPSSSSPSPSSSSPS